MQAGCMRYAQGGRLTAEGEDAGSRSGWKLHDLDQANAASKPADLYSRRASNAPHRPTWHWFASRGATFRARRRCCTAISGHQARRSWCPGRQRAAEAIRRYRVRTTAVLIYAEDVMPKRWSDLSEGTRRLLITAAGADGALRMAALIDIKRRPASQVRGRKQVWTAVVAVVSSAGLVPISYFVLGRRRQP